ncbi:DUF2867 domain-containing protein [Nocardia asteroides]
MVGWIAVPGRARAAHRRRPGDAVAGDRGDRGRTRLVLLPAGLVAAGVDHRLAGGVGLGRGRRDPHRLHEGEALDWWRVERLERPRMLRLRAEMRVPGRAWLELWVEPDGPGATYRQCALFEPHGLAGHLYWKSIAPFHAAIFGGMARNITGAAESSRTG